MPNWFQRNAGPSADEEYDEVYMPPAATLPAPRPNAFEQACRAAGIDSPGAVADHKRRSDAYAQVETERAAATLALRQQAKSHAIIGAPHLPRGLTAEQFCARIDAAEGEILGDYAAEAQAAAEKAAPAGGSQAQTVPAENSAVSPVTYAGDANGAQTAEAKKAQRTKLLAMAGVTAKS